MAVHQLSRADARRIAVRAQLLDGSRPTGLLDAVRHLTLLQIDPTAAIAPNADLVAWSRLGPAYAPARPAGLLGAAAVPRASRHLQGPVEVQGWTNNRNVTQLLEFMVVRGEVAVAGRIGSERL